MKRIVRFLLAALLGGFLLPATFAQSSQNNFAGKAFVFTGALASIPATCTVGQLAFITDATAGQNIYECAAANTWTQQSGGASINATTGVVPYKSGASTFADSPITRVSATVVDIGSAGVLTWNSDTGISRDSAGVIDVGTGAQGSTAGTVQANAFTTKGTTAGVSDYAQGPTNSGASPCTIANSICEQAPGSVTSYLLTKPGTAAQGIKVGTLSGSTITEGISGDTNHSTTVTIGSGTSIGSTSLCSTTFCPVGTYRVNTYIDITTACGTSGTYVVNLIYTDDQGSKTIPININGTGAVASTGVLTTTSTANFGEDTQIVRSTGAASINYSTTAAACGTAGPMVGKLYLSVEPIQ